MQGSRRLLAACLLFISPVIVLLLLFVGGVGFPLILLYAVVVIEGIGIAVWALSGIQPKGSSAGDDYSKTYNYKSRNKAETLATYVKSAAKKRPSNFRQYFRTEISRVVRSIVEESSIENHVQPNNDSPNDHESLVVPEEKTQFSLELDFLLHPPKDGSNKKQEEIPSRRQPDYLSSLEHVLSEIESSQ
jgi:hypothetical protein